MIFVRRQHHEFTSAAAKEIHSAEYDSELPTQAPWERIEGPDAGHILKDPAGGGYPQDSADRHSFFPRKSIEGQGACRSPTVVL